MTASILNFDARRVAPYLADAIAAFLSDPPDSAFQRGYLAALIVTYREGLGRRDPDARVVAAERMMERTAGQDLPAYATISE